ncbi:MAG TPA: DUF3943 domain-containing protein [Polyangiales bacterium]|nr:DUF3943 domain-containing protein [Polyangiales bacterium]
MTRTFCDTALVSLALFIFVTRAPALAQAQEEPAARGPSTFAYVASAEENRVRALLELTAVYTIGFTFYVASNQLLPRYDVGYSWPVFRKKLLGEGLELDVNGLNTNFVGHPAGGSMYYTMARSNRLNVAESTAFAIGGSLLWELFGEVREYISINDMIVTPLAGVGIAEPFFQLGAFFDRSSPRLHNRILAAIFTPVKTLNDLLDGVELDRAQVLDEDGFPADEYHRFDLRAGAASTVQGAKRTFESRLSLASDLVRLPGYDGAGEHSLFFGDANLSSIHIDAALNRTGLVDLEVHTWVGIAGYYFRRARQGLLLGVTLGYQYLLHDFDRDRPYPRDRISSVQPLGLVLENRFDLGRLLSIVHLEGGLDFGGLRPYALMPFLQLPEAAMLPKLVADNAYCFVRGAHLLASLLWAVEQFEVAGKVRYERYREIDVPVSVDDSRLLLEGRTSLALGDSPARLSLIVQRRSRKGTMGAAQAARAETSVAIELGAMY